MDSVSISYGVCETHDQLNTLVKDSLMPSYWIGSYFDTVPHKNLPI